MTVYPTENIINCRDLGGYACPGGVTAGGRVIRCGIPKTPSQADIRILKNAGVKDIIDLRGVKEAEDMPSFFKDNPDFYYHHIPTLEANPALNDINLPIWEMYAISLREYSRGYRDVFRLLISFDGPFLIHCFLGKDRTGILSALLLSLAGVSRELIARDYRLSEDYVLPFAKREIENKTGLIWEQDESRLRSKEENILKCLEFIDSAYGGPEGYLETAGLDSREVERSKKLLL